MKLSTFPLRVVTLVAVECVTAMAQMQPEATVTRWDFAGPASLCGNAFVNGRYFIGGGAFLNPVTNEVGVFSIGTQLLAPCFSPSARVTNNLYFTAGSSPVRAAGMIDTNTFLATAFDVFALNLNLVGPFANSMTANENSGRMYVAGGQALHEISTADGALKTWNLSVLGLSGQITFMAMLPAGKVAMLVDDSSNDPDDHKKLVVVDPAANTASVFSVGYPTGSLVSHISADDSGNIYGQIGIWNNQNTFVWRFDTATSQLTKWALGQFSGWDDQEAYGTLTPYPTSGGVIMGLGSNGIRGDTWLFRLNTSTNTVTIFSPALGESRSGAHDPGSGRFYYYVYGTAFVEYKDFVGN